MIEIKGIQAKSDPIKKQIVFCGQQSIKLTEEEWQQFDNIMMDLDLKPNDVLEEIIYAGLATYNKYLRRRYE